MSTFSGLNTADDVAVRPNGAPSTSPARTSPTSTPRATPASGSTCSPSAATRSRPSTPTSPGIGGGVNADTVIRIRDVFLEARGHTEHATGSRLTEETNALTQIESAFREPGDSGLQNVLADMWAGWGDVANQPHDSAAKAQVLQQTETVVAVLKASRSTLDQQWTSSRDNLVALVAEVNTASSALADINKAIQRATQAGLPAHELADRRDVLVMQLADQVGGSVQPGDDGTMNVFVNGTPIVFGETANIGQGRRRHPPRQRPH